MPKEHFCLSTVIICVMVFFCVCNYVVYVYTYMCRSRLVDAMHIYVIAQFLADFQSLHSCRVCCNQRSSLTLQWPVYKLLSRLTCITSDLGWAMYITKTCSICIEVTSLTLGMIAPQGFSSWLCLCARFDFSIQ